MRYIIWILIVLQVPEFSFGQSIQEPFRSGQYQKLKEEFQSNRIETARLPAFEKRAQQKVKDMFNYIEIISNKSYDEALRKEALDMSLDLFIKTATVKSEILTAAKAKPYDIVSFFNAVLHTELSEIQLTLSNIKILHSLAYNEAKSAYTGQLTVHVDVLWKGRGRSFSNDYLIDFQVLKVTKKFGDKTEKVWELLLGDWYPRP